MSLEGKWVEMMGLITDDMLHEIATIGTFDEIVLWSPRAKAFPIGPAPQTTAGRPTSRPRPSDAARVPS